MDTRSNLNILYTVLVVMVVQANCDQFMCYICDDCPQITETTPIKACDESFFNQETTLPPTTPTSPTTEKPTTTIHTTTVDTTETTETTETTVSEATQSTSPTRPTPPTAGPVETTTPLPTPPNTGTVAGPIDAEIAKANDTSFTTETADTQDTTIGTTILEPVRIFVDPVQIRMRSRRDVFSSLYTYYCYSVQQNNNGTTKTSRGCSRITQTQSLCNQLEEENNNTKFSSCTPCSNTLCNSSTSVGTSMVAITMGLLAALLFRSNA